MITKKSYYGLIALAHLAVAGKNRHIGIKEIAQSRSLPHRFLELLFSRLRTMEILNSTRGATGGYQLAREPGKISLREIILVCEGLKDLNAPESTAGMTSPNDPVAATLTEIVNAQMRIVSENLMAISLKDVIDRSGDAAEMYWI